MLLGQSGHGAEWGGDNLKLALIGREVWNSLCYWSINNQFAAW